MDSRAYAALTPGLETPDELDACTLLVNSQVSCASTPRCHQAFIQHAHVLCLSHSSLNPLKPLLLCLGCKQVHASDCFTVLLLHTMIQVKFSLPGMYASTCK